MDIRNVCYYTIQNSNFTIEYYIQMIFQNSLDFTNYSIDTTFLCSLNC